MASSKESNQTLIVASKNHDFLIDFFKYLNKCPLQIKKKFFGNGLDVIKEIFINKPFLLIISTDLEGLDGLSTIDIIRQKKGNSISFVVIMENDSLELQEQVVKRNVLYKSIEPPNFNDLRDIIVRVKKRNMNEISLIASCNRR